MFLETVFLETIHNLCYQAPDELKDLTPKACISFSFSKDVGRNNLQTLRSKLKHAVCQQLNKMFSAFRCREIHKFSPQLGNMQHERHAVSLVSKNTAINEQRPVRTKSQLNERHLCAFHYHGVRVGVRISLWRGKRSNQSCSE